MASVARMILMMGHDGTWFVMRQTTVPVENICRGGKQSFLDHDDDDDADDDDDGGDGDGDGDGGDDDDSSEKMFFIKAGNGNHSKQHVGGPATTCAIVLFHTWTRKCGWHMMACWHHILLSTLQLEPDCRFHLGVLT